MISKYFKRVQKQLRIETGKKGIYNDLSGYHAQKYIYTS